MEISDRLATLPQYLAPQRALSRIACWLARCRISAVKTFLIGTFVKIYDVELNEAVRRTPDEYLSFNDFFTRALGADARPYNKEDPVLLSPADGQISQIGDIDSDRLLQAKGKYYTLNALLAGDFKLARQLEGGRFATVYLAPNNYHRVHAPAGGRIIGVRYVPGKLFSVNQKTARSVDNLFARNERIIVEMDSECGKLAIILVGAMLVSSMELTCCETTSAARAANRTKRPVVVALEDAKCTVQRGEEIGRFNMGSTVIILAERGRVNWAADFNPGTVVRVGQTLAEVLPQGHPHSVP